MADKSEAATPRRLDEAREEGNVVRSQELNAAAIMVVAALLLGGPGKQLVSVFEEIISSSITTLPTVDLTQRWLEQMGYSLLTKVLPPTGLMMIGLLLTGVAVTLGQTKFLWSSKRVGFDLKRLDPLNGFKRIFSGRGLIEVFRALLKLSLVGWVSYGFLRDNMAQLIALVQYDLRTAVGIFAGMAVSLALNVGEVYLVLAVADYAYQRWQLMRSLRMSKEEIKEEHRRSEGDPFLKGRIRAQMRRMARNRMMSNVPKATVIVTNPTHLAIAIEYREGMSAPRVLAKGAHYTAQRIVALAKQHSIPVVQYTPSVFAMLPRLLERAGNSEHGSITGFFTVLVEGDDFNEPICDAVRGILDGHIILSRALAARNHYPAIDVLNSVSRVMPALVDKDHLAFAANARKHLATYEKARDLINIGAYVRGSDLEIDAATYVMPSLLSFLQQDRLDASDFEDTLAGLSAITELTAGPN